MLISLDLNLVNLCVVLNAHGFHFAVDQTADLVLLFNDHLGIFGADWIVAIGDEDGAFTFEKLVKSLTIADFRRTSLLGGYDVSSKEVASLFRLLLEYIWNFREHELRTWYVEKRRRIEAREKERRHIAATYQPEDARY